MNNNLKKFKEDYNKAKEDDKEVFDSMGVCTILTMQNT